MKDGSLAAEQAERSKQRYAEIHSSLIRSMTREKAALDEAKNLKRQLEVGLLKP